MHLIRLPSRKVLFTFIPTFISRKFRFLCIPSNTGYYCSFGSSATGTVDIYHCYCPASIPFSSDNSPPNCLWELHLPNSLFQFEEPDVFPQLGIGKWPQLSSSMSCACPERNTWPYWPNENQPLDFSWNIEQGFSSHCPPIPSWLNCWYINHRESSVLPENEAYTKENSQVGRKDWKHL